MINATFKDYGTNRDNMAYAMVFSCVMVLGLPLNAGSLWTLLRHHSLKSPGAVFMVNLALSDLLLVTSLPTRVYFYATGNWPFGIRACVFTTMLFRNNIRSSSTFITFIAVDRLLAVVYPLRSRLLRTNSKAWNACALVWLWLLIATIPEGIYMSQGKRDCNSTNCYVPGCKDSTPAWAYVQSLLVFFMLAVNVASTSMVSWNLRGHPSTFLRANNKMNVMLIFVMNLVMFIVFFLPLSVSLLLNAWRHKGHDIRPTLCLASVNCCFDPLIYYFTLDSFWKKKDDDSSTFEQ